MNAYLALNYFLKIDEKFLNIWVKLAKALIYNSYINK